MGWKFVAALSAMLISVSPAVAGGAYVPGISVSIQPASVPNATTGDYSPFHSVAIITAIGQSMILGRDEWFGHYSTLDIADMNLDKFVENTLRDRLQRGHYTVVEVSYDRAKLAAIPNGRMDVTASELRDYLGALPAQGIDAFIVLRPRGAGAGAHTAGLSLNQIDIPGKSLSGVVANFEIDIIDAKTLRTVGQAMSRIRTTPDKPPIFANSYEDNDMKLDLDKTPTPDQRIRIKVQFEKLLSKALTDTFDALEFGPPAQALYNASASSQATEP